MLQCTICGKQLEKKYYLCKTVLCSSSECFQENFWREWVFVKDNPQVVRVDGNHFFIGPESKSSTIRGFGGREFRIRFFNGRQETTTNLWHQGTIPEKFRNELPDNAEFVQIPHKTLHGLGYYS